MSSLLAALAALVTSWAITVPLYRFKELRPKTPRDVSDEGGVEIRAVQRHARCPDCLRDHTPTDVLPVWSWATGCPECKRRMPVSLVLFQLGLPIVAALIASAFDSAWVVVPYVWFAVVVAAIALVDARIWLIPWWIPWVGSAVGFALMVPASLALEEPEALIRAAGTGAVTFGLFFVLWFVAPGRLGFGDVRLAFMIGLFLGWLSPLLAIWGLLLGSLVGVVIGLWAMVARGGGHFAFGPALGAGALLAVLLHTPLLG